MEGDGVGRRPQPRARLDQGVGAERIAGIELALVRHRDEVDRGLRPALGEAAVPEGIVTQRLDLPDAVLLHIFILVNAAFPPGALLALGGFVQAGLHLRAAADLGALPVGRDVDDHLQLRMIEQPAVARAVMTLRETGLEALDIEAADALLALVDAAEEPDLAILGEQVDHLIILRFVDEIAVGILHLADLALVLQPPHLLLEIGDTLAEQAELGGVHRVGGHIILLVRAMSSGQRPSASSRSISSR